MTESVAGGAWGVHIVNTSGSTFHDVRITARMSDHDVTQPIELRFLPPGEYFVEHNRSRGWEFARRAEECAGWLRPLAVTDKYRVTELRFTDNRDRTWTTDDRAVLRACPAATTRVRRGSRSP